MPYFSFSIKQNFFTDTDQLTRFNEIKVNKVYFSKSTFLWKNLNKKKNKKYLNFINFERRTKLIFNKDKKSKILFCLPPNIGLGDAIEYGLAFKAIFSNDKYIDSAIAFVGRYKAIFKKYFFFDHVYEEIISQTNMKKYDTIFHVSLEIHDFKYQKYVRTDIEDILTKYFNIPKLRPKIMTIKRKIKKINIFPVSQSPIRSMPPKLIDEIIKYYEKDYKINVIYDNLSTISDYLVKNVNSSNYKKIYPSSLENLCQIIKKTELGIFIDSGPLHLAKIFGIKGVLIITSVGENVLLNQFHNIKEVKNSFYSKYCKSPCGLTNIFNWKNNIGCYESLHVFKKNLIKSNNLNLLQRGSMKKKYIDYMLNPVGCVKHLDSNNIINQINNCINK